MAQVIHKYYLDLKEHQMVKIHSGAKLLSINYLKTPKLSPPESVVLWAQVDTLRPETFMKISIYFHDVLIEGP